MGQIADLADRRDIAVHGIDRLEGDDLGAGGTGFLELALEIGQIVVAEHMTLAAGVADAGDHRGVVQRIGKDRAVGQAAAQGLQRRLVGDVARGEDQRRRLAVQIGQLALEQHVVMVGAGDVARAAGASARQIERCAHRLEHHRVLAHAEIIVRTPDGDLTGAAIAMVARQREIAGLALEIGEDAVAAFGLEVGQRLAEKAAVVHREFQCGQAMPCPARMPRIPR